MSEGDMYTNPGDCIPLANSLAGSIEAYSGSELAVQLGDMFSASYVSMAAAEVVLAAEHGVAGDVNDWERARYIEFS